VSIRFTYALLIYHYYRLILRLVCTSIPHLASRMNWKKTAGSRWTCFDVRVPRTLNYPAINLNPLTCPVWSQCTPVPDRQADWQTDEHQAIARWFVLTNLSRTKSEHLNIRGTNHCTNSFLSLRRGQQCRVLYILNLRETMLNRHMVHNFITLSPFLIITQGFSPLHKRRPTCKETHRR